MTDEPIPTRMDAPRRAAVHLQHSIVRGDLVPGEKVKQNDWAKRLGVSGVPLREALNILTAQDLLQHVPRRGYYVATMDNAQILQIYRLRIFIETEMIKDTRWPTEAELAFMENKYDQFHEELAAGHLERAHELYRDLYYARVELSRLDLFSREAKRLFQQTVPYRMANFASSRAEDPELKEMRLKDRAMLSALRAHDAEALTLSVLGTLNSTIGAIGRVDVGEMTRRRGRGRKFLETVI